MIIYYSGIDSHKEALYTAVENGCRHLMLSYHYKDKYTLQIRRSRGLGLHLFLDSGAFSAWKKGVAVDLSRYMGYIKEHCFGKYIVLDVVGDPEASYFNLKRMEKEGLYPVPVFHLGSDLKYLKQLADEGYKYICLGGTVGVSKGRREAFFDQCFNEFPKLYYHGLGMTDPALMQKYPWFSGDSTTWLIGRKYGRLATLDGQRAKLPKSMSIQERLAVNVRFFNQLEDLTERGIS